MIFECFLKNLVDEVSILRQMKHENILDLHDVLHDEDNVYIITELCEGGDLNNTYFQNGNQVPDEELDVLQLMKQVFEALAFLHGNGIAHRDIKQENIMLNGGSVKLINFGFAMEQVSDGELITEFEGTEDYFWPEMEKELPH